MDRNVIEWIKDLVSSEMDETEIAEGLEGLQIYLGLELSDLKYEQVISNMANSNDSQKKNYIKDFTDIERFMKNLGDIIWDGEISRQMSRDMETGDSRTMLRGLYTQYFNVVPRNIALNGSNPDDYPGNHISEFIKVYQFRNSEIHNHLNDLRPQKVLDICISMLVCVLCLCKKYKEELNEKHYSKAKQEELKISEFCQRICEEYKRDSSKNDFHYLDVRWYDPYSKNEKQVTVGDVVNSDEYSLIKFLGEAGVGKTTALKRIEVNLAEKYISGNSKVIPIYIELKYLVDKDEIILDAICRKLNISSLNDTVLDLKDVCLLLDGYNEILNKYVQEKVCSEVNQLSRNHPECKIVVSDRGKARKNDNLLPDSKKFYLYTISINEKNIYFKQNINEAKDYLVVQEKIKLHPLYFDTLISPLQLKIFVELVNEKHAIPDDLVGSYFKLLFSREADKGDENADYLPYFLERLAFEYNNDPMSEKSILEVIKKTKEDYGFVSPDSMYCLKLIKDLGILIEEDGLYSFANQDYFNYFLSEMIIN